MDGVHGVFSMQTSSGQGPELGLSDADEERFGMMIADLAVQAGVNHFVYTSVAAVGEKPTGMGHFDSKAAIERHIRTLPLDATIIRPTSFMEMLTMPGFGLDEGRFNFFQQPDQPMQFIAVEDIGKIVAAIFADPANFVGRTIEIAGDELTGSELGALFTEAAGRSIAYARFPDDILAANPFLARLTALLDEGYLTGHADIDALRTVNPELQTFRAWLAGSGRAGFEKALGTAGSWQYTGT
jgi:uncharacterized protein YbjT (DUF2867 family)